MDRPVYWASWGGGQVCSSWSFLNILSSLRALNVGLVRRWSDRTEVEFQNWAEMSAFGPRRDRMCVTMSSSSGNGAAVCTGAWVGWAPWWSCYGALQGSGRGVSVMNSAAMFARERSCRSWRLPENPTILDGAQRNGSTLDTRFRCIILKALGDIYIYYDCESSYGNRITRVYVCVCMCSVSCFTCLAVPKRERLGKTLSPSVRPLKVLWSP